LLFESYNTRSSDNISHQLPKANNWFSLLVAKVLKETPKEEKEAKLQQILAITGNEIIQPLTTMNYRALLHDNAKIHFPRGSL
jgi:hypothetical protein